MRDNVEIPDSVRSFAERYTAAWCSQNPDSVAAHFSTDGSLCINAGEPAVGRAAISATAASFMRAFPDLEVRLDRLALQDERIEYHWTLLGTNTGPSGTGQVATGHHVHISGCEVWRLEADGLIEASEGRFDAALYQQQLEHGAD